MKNKIKIGTILVDDEKLVYEVVGVFPYFCVVQPIPNQSNFSCDVMTYISMENEGWKIYNNSTK